MNIVTQIETLRTHAERIANDAARTFDDFPVGTVAHQGDVMFVAIKGLPEGAKPRANRQIADGDTQGSRHVAESGTLYDCPAANVVVAVKAATGCTIMDYMAGPVIVGPAEITHPEHGDHVYAESVTLACVFQRAWSQHQQAEARARD